MNNILNITPSEAIKLQEELRQKIRLKPFLKNPKYIAGADISFNKYSSTVFAGFVILDYKSMDIVETAFAVEEVNFPYIPGLLSFREIPPLLKAWKKIKTKPDVIIFDGHGIAHPRRLGIAAHAGFILNKPSIGCAKSLLTGVFKEPSVKVGATSSLLDTKTKEQIGIVLRTKNKVKPVFISPGYKMDFKNTLRIIKNCTGKYRIPEPTRLAHNYVNQIRKEYFNRKNSD